MLQPMMTPRFALEFTLLADIDEVMPRLCEIINELSAENDNTISRSNMDTGGHVWHAPDGTTAYWHYDWRYTHSERGASVARFQLAQAKPNGTLLVYVMESDKPTTPHTPRTLQKLMRAFDGRIMDSDPQGRDERVSVTLHRVDAQTMPMLINHLHDPGRVLPMVVLSATDGAEDEANALMGLASVWAYDGPEASQTFRRMVYGNHATFNGAARIFPPRFWEEPTRPPYFKQEEWGVLRVRLAQTTAALFVPTKAVLDAKRAYDTRDHVAYIGKTATQETKALLALSEDENNNLRRENDQLLARVAELEGEVDNLAGRLANATTSIRLLSAYAPTAQPDPNDAPEEDPPANMPEAVRRAADVFGDVLVFHKKAHNSAKDSPYTYPEKVWKALNAIADVARRRAQPDGLGMRVEDAFAARGQDYSAHESQITGGQNDYYVLHGGKNVPIHEHVKLGVGDANVCLRIYMCWLRDENKYLIGHVGRHLPNTMS